MPEKLSILVCYKSDQDKNFIGEFNKKKQYIIILNKTKFFPCSMEKIC